MTILKRLKNIIFNQTEISDTELYIYMTILHYYKRGFLFMHFIHGVTLREYMFLKNKLKNINTLDVGGELEILNELYNMKNVDRLDERVVTPRDILNALKKRYPGDF